MNIRHLIILATFLFAAIGAAAPLPDPGPGSGTPPPKLDYYKPVTPGKYRLKLDGTGVGCIALTALFVALAAARPLFAVEAEGGGVAVLSPQAYQVVQRDPATVKGKVGTAGYAAGSANVKLVLAGEGPLEWRVVALEGAFGKGTEWKGVEIRTEKGQSHGVLKVPAGGWYRLELRRPGKLEVVAKVEPMGVGEVFIVAGQSYAGNHSDEKLKVAEPRGRVVALNMSKGQWAIANDPQPNASSPESSDGSIWPAFGDAMVEGQQVPVGLVNVSRSSTTSGDWLPEKGLHKNLVRAAQTVGRFRAVLWQQGESDVMSKTPTEEYVGRLKTIHAAFAKECETSVLWVAAKSTVHPTVYNNPKQEGVIRDAIEQLWKTKGFARGPDTDTLIGENRGGPGTKRHFSGIGQRRAAALWVAAITEIILNSPYAGFTADVPTVGNPPGRPTSLLTELQVEPLAIDQLKPRLAWQVQDPDRGERQTAYQILVASDRDILAADRGDRWDSGRVASTQSTAVLYGGQELKPDQRSWWKVRTWDKDGTPGPYSEPARFDTGIGMTGEGAWTAKFIWDGSKNTNNYAYFRKEFTVPPGQKIRSAKLFASAHNVYQLHLDGSELGYGPARSNPFLYGQYNVYDLTDQLVAGKHVLAARCHWMGTWGDSGINAAPAFIAELRLVFSDGSKLTVATDPTWKTLAATPFDEEKPVLFGANGGINNRSAERFDARKEPLGWLKAGFDDGSWASASDVKCAYNLFAQVTPRSRIQHVIDPVKITQDGELWKVDFGKNMYAVPRLTMIANEPGDVITCTYFDDGVCEKSYQDGWDQYTCRGGGRETYEKWNGWGGIRSMSVKGYRGTLTADNVKALVRYSEGDKQGDFSSSDPQLNAIYGLCEWTSRMATQEGGYFDDDSTEQSSWGCDGYTGGENLFYSIRNYRVQHKTLRDYIAEQAANGMIYACSPAQKYHLPDFSLNLYQSTWDYHLFTNDLTLIETTYPGLRKFLVEFLGTRRDPMTKLSTVKGKSWGDGFSTSDWNPDYIDASGKALTVHNMLYYNALRVMSRLASDLGRKADIAEFDAIATEVKDGINTALFDGVEKYRDGLGVDKFHLLPAVWAIHNDLVPADKREAVLRYIRNYPGYGLELASIGQCVFFDTMYPLGTEGGKLMEFLHHPDRWLKMIPNYCTTERVDGEGIPLAVLPNSPGTMLPRYVGGVRPTSPGFSTFDIKPTVDGLAWAKVQVPTVKGMVTVAWQKPVAATGPADSGKDSGGSGLDLMATIPVNTLAEVWLPKQGLNRVMVSEGNAVVWDGSRFKEGTPGVLSVNDTKLWVRLTVGSGSYKFKIGPAGDQGQR